MKVIEQTRTDARDRRKLQALEVTAKDSESSSAEKDCDKYDFSVVEQAVPVEGNACVPPSSVRSRAYEQRHEQRHEDPHNMSFEEVVQAWWCRPCSMSCGRGSGYSCLGKEDCGDQAVEEDRHTFAKQKQLKQLEQDQLFFTIRQFGDHGEHITCFSNKQFGDASERPPIVLEESANERTI